MHHVVDTVFRFATSHLLALATALVTLVGAALATYAREQVRAGTSWALLPLTRAFPWNGGMESFHDNDKRKLIANFSLVDVYLADPGGRIARYQKTSNYTVTSSEMSWYQEGVTAEGRVFGFGTLRGSIVKTVKEHGFYVSQIDLAETLTEGSIFTNVYVAHLHDCFPNKEEHWTQELAFQTKHLTLQIHFPQGRPPKAVSCKRIEGTANKRVKRAAKIVELFGNKSIVWEIDRPRTNEILKLEWTW